VFDPNPVQRSSGSDPDRNMGAPADGRRFPRTGRPELERSLGHRTRARPSLGAAAGRHSPIAGARETVALRRRARLLSCRPVAMKRSVARARSRRPSGSRIRPHKLPEAATLTPDIRPANDQAKPISRHRSVRLSWMANNSGERVPLRSPESRFYFQPVLLWKVCRALPIDQTNRRRHRGRRPLQIRPWAADDGTQCVRAVSRCRIWVTSASAKAVHRTLRKTQRGRRSLNY